MCISGSLDRTCKVWDVASGQCVHTLRGHNDEILDVCYNSTGSKLSTASADGTSRIFNTMTGACQAILIGHEGEISKVCFNPQGTRVLTASSDKTARIWDVETGDCLQVGHYQMRTLALLLPAEPCDLAFPCFRSWRVTQTRFSAARSITRARPSSPARKTTRAASGLQSAEDQGPPTCRAFLLTSGTV